DVPEQAVTRRLRLRVRVTRPIRDVNAMPQATADGTRMKILVANLGSTSFKYRLFDMADERVIARGGVERIGSSESKCFVEAGGIKEEEQVEARDHAVAVRLCLDQ